MRLHVTSRNGTIRARLGDALDIGTAAEAQDHLLQLFGAAKQLEFDLSSLTEIDTAGIQLLLAVRKEGIARDVVTRFVHPSPPAQEAFGLLGKRDFFDEAVLTVPEKA